LFKHFADYGWSPTLLTPKTNVVLPKELTVLETPDYVSKYGEMKLSNRKLAGIRPYLKKVYRIYKELAEYPDGEWGWKEKAFDQFEAGAKDFDVVISSSAPVTSHFIARDIHLKYGVPWVAELRDLWTQNHNYPYSRFRRFFERRLEHYTLKEADLIVTVSDRWARKLSKTYGNVAVIRNGFDGEPRHSKPTDHFTITYTGQTYDNYKPNLVKFFKVLSETGIHAQVRFFGEQPSYVQDYAKRFGVDAVFYGRVPREEAWQRQSESQVLLLFNWEAKGEDGVAPLKIYEYFAASRPILCVGGFGDDEVHDLLEQTNAGYYCKSEAGIESNLQRMYREFQSQGSAAFNGVASQISRFNFKNLARKYVEQIENLRRKDESEKQEDSR
jgi:hypothetical protein